MITPDDFPTIAEIATALRTSKRNVRRAVESGSIPVIRVSERVVRVNLPEFIGKSAGGAGAADPTPSIPDPPLHPSAHDSESA